MIIIVWKLSCLTEPYPVKIRPSNNSTKLDAFAISTQPQTHGIAASLIVFSRPIHSINIAETRHPAGTESTIILAVGCFLMNDYY